VISLIRQKLSHDPLNALKLFIPRHAFGFFIRVLVKTILGAPAFKVGESNDRKYLNLF